MKKLWIFCITLMLLAMLPLAAFATEAEETEAPVRQPGQCGEEITWKLEGDTLTISGTGKMDDFPEAAPWAEHKDAITKVVFEGSVSYIGSNAFRDYDSLREVNFGSAMYEIGAGAFYSCDGLTKIELPSTFKVFGEESFRNCPNLKEIHCSGRFPSFRLNCLWDTYAKIYFPAERPWPVDLVIQLEGAFKGRIEFLASDGTDPYVPTEPTEATEPTKATEPEETTQPSTEPTQPVTEATEPAETTQPEVTEETPAETEETQPTETGAPEVQPPQPKENSVWTILAVISGAVVLVMAAVIVWLLVTLRKGGGKYAR